jgi:hypothetical protein
LYLNPGFLADLAGWALRFAQIVRECDDLGGPTPAASTIRLIWRSASGERQVHMASQYTSSALSERSESKGFNFSSNSCLRLPVKASARWTRAKKEAQIVGDFASLKRL